MKNILVVRLSAMGDVAISVQIIHGIINQNKNIQIIMLTRKAFQPLFNDNPRIKFVEPDLYGRHKGVLGLFRLFLDINKKYKIYKVIDIHNVLRTKILRFFYFLKFIKSFKIDKGRNEKKKLVSEKNKILKQLKNSSERYIDTFRNAGLNFEISKFQQKPNFKLTNRVADYLSDNKQRIKIGIAAFAFFKEKMYPIEQMEIVINKLLEKNCVIYLFGGGKKEKEIAKKLALKNKNIKSVIGKFTLREEMSIINQMNTMLTMDSANMHIAALTNTNIVSIWGATHPFAGFLPFNSKQHAVIQIDNQELDCRPCSIFGNKKCYKNNLACMKMIKPETISKLTINN